MTNTADSIGVNDNNTTVAGTTVSGMGLTLTNASAPLSGVNTVDGLNFPAGSIAGSNVTNGINFASATGFTNFLKTPSINISSAGAVTGATSYNGLVITANTGAITTGTWNGTAVDVAHGGTGQTSYTIGDILYASAAGTLSKLADTATGNALISGGVGVAPSWGNVDLTAAVAGILPVANGGTGISALGTGVATWLGTPSSANLLAAMTTKTGTGSLVFGTAPTFTTNLTSPLIIGGTAVSSTLTLESTSGAGSSDAIIFKTGSAAEAMRINTSGNVGIGNTNPSVDFVVGTTPTFSVNTANTNGNIFAVATSTGSTYFEVQAQNGYVGIANTAPSYVLDVTGQARFTGGYTTSDQRYKNTITSLDANSSLAEINQLRPVSFYWNNPQFGTGQQLGFIAQEVQPIFPQLVSTDDQGYLSLNYGGLVSPLVSAIQELDAGYQLNNLGSGATSTIASWYQGTSTPAIIIDEAGNMGIGTTTASTSPYKLSVGGDVMATGFVNLSEEAAKTDITHVDATTTEDFLTTLRGMMVATYHYKNEATTTADRLGFIAEEAPTIVKSSAGNGIDLYKLITLAIGSIQALANNVDQLGVALQNLTTRVAALEAAAGSAASGAVGGVATNISGTVQSFLTSQSVTIANGTVTAGTVAATQFNTVADANGQSAAGSGTVAAGEDKVVINNTYVNQGSHVFVTFNNDPGGSWYVSKSQEPYSQS